MIDQIHNGIRVRALAVVATIPEGCVTTYGIIAKHLNTGPRQIAKILAGLSREESETYPWFRVVAAQGVISSTKRRGVGPRQIKRLRAEGVAVTVGNRVEDFKLLLWEPGLEI